MIVMVGRALAVILVAVTCASCVGLREHERAVDRYESGRLACNAGDTSGCREAVAGAEGLSARGVIVGTAAVNEVLKRGCELGVAEHCRLASGLLDEEKVRFMLRACRLGDLEGCSFVLRYQFLAPAVQAQAEARICELSAPYCIRLATQLVEYQPELGGRLAERGCALDPAICADADVVIARSQVPDACYRRHGNWNDCALPSMQTDVLRRACAGAAQHACVLLGERIIAEKNK